MNVEYYLIKNKYLIKFDSPHSYKYVKSKWVKEYEWIPKIFIESFWDYEEITEEKALELIKKGVV